MTAAAEPHARAALVGTGVQADGEETKEELARARTSAVTRPPLQEIVFGPVCLPPGTCRMIRSTSCWTLEAAAAAGASASPAAATSAAISFL